VAHQLHPSNVGQAAGLPHVELVPEVLLVERAGIRRRIAGGIGLAWECLFGSVALLLILAILAAMPVLQFLSLGYLLEAGGRIARTGRLRAGFFGARRAAQLGTMVLGTTLVLLPVQLVSSFWLSAELIDPDGPVAHRWRKGLTVLTILVALHIALACARGGKLRYFLWPFGNPFWFYRRVRQGGYLGTARDAVWDFVTALRLPYYFWLGLRGFVGGFVWLALPVTLLAAGRQVPPLGFLGGALLVCVLLYLPFLQMHFAAQNRLRALFALGVVRDMYRGAPWAFAFSFFITLAFAVPLYLLKIEILPREAAWLPSIVFIAFIYPARLLTGWAYARALRQSLPRHAIFRWTGRLAMLAAAVAYGIIVYFTQFIAWSGIWSLYEQHAFLLPVPFFSM
jgi:hypothetical protein